MHRKVWLILSTLLAWPLPAVASVDSEERDAALDASAEARRVLDEAGDDLGPADAPEAAVHVCLSDDSIEGELLRPEKEADAGPCLSVQEEPLDEPEPTPCLNMMEPEPTPCLDMEPEPTPCLDMAPDPDTTPCLNIVEPRPGRCDVSDSGDSGGLPLLLGGALLLSAAGRRRRADAVIDRLERAGALPQDVLDRLRKRGE